jgi:hypothetical protein
MRVESDLGTKSNRSDRRNGLGSCKHDARILMSFSISIKKQAFFSSLLVQLPQMLHQTR